MDAAQVVTRISMVLHVRGCDFREAVAHLTGEDTTPAPSAPNRRRLRQNRRKTTPSSTRLIADIVRELVPLRRPPGQRYFAETRKIDTVAIADVLERADAIGWHPGVLFREEGHPLDGKRLGCIVGVMTDPVTAKPTGAISRTYILEGRKVGKAKTLGAPAGIVRLIRR